MSGKIHNRVLGSRSASRDRENSLKWKRIGKECCLDCYSSNNPTCVILHTIRTVYKEWDLPGYYSICYI